MPWFAAALPVAPGKENEARKRGEGFRKHLAEYTRLNQGAQLKRHLEFLQESPMGATMITLYEFEGDGSKLGRAFTSSDYDKWWLSHIKDVHGMDLTQPFTPPKLTLVHEWKGSGVS
jgi:hypothetical protein